MYRPNAGNNPISKRWISPWKLAFARRLPTMWFRALSADAYLQGTQKYTLRGYLLDSKCEPTKKHAAFRPLIRFSMRIQLEKVIADLEGQQNRNGLFRFEQINCIDALPLPYGYSSEDSRKTANRPGSRYLPYSCRFRCLFQRTSVATSSKNTD